MGAFFLPQAAQLSPPARYSYSRYNRSQKSTRVSHGEGKIEMKGSSVELYQAIDLDVE